MNVLVVVDWIDDSTTLSYQNVYRGVNKSKIEDMVFVKKVDPSIRTLADSVPDNIKDGDTIYYIVEAVGEFGDGVERKELSEPYPVKITLDHQVPYNYYNSMDKTQQ